MHMSPIAPATTRKSTALIRPRFPATTACRAPTRLGAPAPGRSLLINITFTAPLAATNQHSVYEWSLGRSAGPSCAVGGGDTSATTMTPIRAGQHVMLQDTESPCPGTYNGLVTYQPNGWPGHDTLFWRAPIHDGSVLVGRFTFLVR
jgi:hypothetical protein